MSEDQMRQVTAIRSDGSPPASNISTLHTGAVLLLAALAAMGALATNIILPAFPSIARDLGVSISELSGTLSSFFLMFGLGQLVVGPLSDRFGRQRLVLSGLAIFMLGSVLCALADSLPVLIAGRIIQALGVCATAVLSRAIARDLYDGEALARALSLTMVAMAAAPGFSPLIGGILSDALGWRALFIIIALVALVVALIYRMRLGETHAPDRRSPLSVGDVFRSYAALINDRRLMSPALAVSLVIGALYAFFSMAPAILLTGFKLSSLQFGLFFAMTVLVVFTAGFIAPRVANRWGQMTAARIGLMIALVGSVVLLWGPTDFTCFCIALSIFLLGMGLFNPLGTALALHPFGKQAGAASALLGFMQMGCAALAITCGTLLTLPPYTVLGVVLVSAMATAFLCFLTAE
ncbi:DHA1 family bicyclomycin/chloramphenicol resistance-like MFS transporter [Pseudomonas hunanensis]|uniref:DHA1 family bicyclomycin/chloramphenicol resistance-like MFS transporter n=1 Tax=Pseudomonas hunanensis TaxID=1247546 RepID=A0ACC6JXZ7_9PSED|nr:multidrug effflux MFS transporter [Pseudomonas hunanensis]MDR6711075.1 DHA1 family bicyclomycin/chloramphenicol resistance-like MFS transporter [Pseudomonas hunanensis]